MILVDCLQTLVCLPDSYGIGAVTAVRRHGQLFISTTPILQEICNCRNIHERGVIQALQPTPSPLLPTSSPDWGHPKDEEGLGNTCCSTLPCPWEIFLLESAFFFQEKTAQLPVCSQFLVGDQHFPRQKYSTCPYPKMMAWSYSL